MGGLDGGIFLTGWTEWTGRGINFVRGCFLEGVCRAGWHGADELLLIENSIVFYNHSFEAM